MSARLLITFGKRLAQKKETAYKPHQVPAEKTVKAIKKVIKNKDDIKKGIKSFSNVTGFNFNQNKAVYKQIKTLMPEFYKSMGFGTKEYYKKVQKLNQPPYQFDAEKRKKLKTLFQNTKNKVLKNQGNVLDLRDVVFAKKLNTDPARIQKLRKEMGLIVSPRLQSAIRSAAKRKDKKPITLKGIEKISQVKEQTRKGGRATPEVLVMRFLTRSAGEPMSDVKLTKFDPANIKNNMFKIGGKKIDFEYIKKNLKTDPLFDEVNNAYNYKFKILTSKFPNPKTGKIESLNTIAYDILGNEASNLFHIHHKLGVGMSPLKYLQVVTGPVNFKEELLRKRLNPESLGNYSAQTKKMSIGHIFNPTVKNPPIKRAAQNTYEAILNVYKQKYPNYQQALGYKKGGIICLIN